MSRWRDCDWRLAREKKGKRPYGPSQDPSPHPRAEHQDSGCCRPRGVVSSSNHVPTASDMRRKDPPMPSRTPSPGLVSSVWALSEVASSVWALSEVASSVWALLEVASSAFASKLTPTLSPSVTYNATAAFKEQRF